MKKVLSFVTIAAIAVMVLSCKNDGKGKDEAKDAAQDAVEAVEDAAKEGAEAVEKAAKDLGDAVKDAAEDAAKRADEALEKLDDIIPYASAEVKPTFNGGDADAFVKYIQQNVKYPQVALDNEEQGRVTINFVVDANGKIRNAKVVKGVSEALDAEALRVVENAPDWTPAKQGGKNVPVTYSVPVVFAIK
ncbi:MAG: energy transducer TonB [Bacteroidales bacterium]|nr:energy transducer TonB [Bacteroidales bacterium]